MISLVIAVGVAIGVSFCCSLLEAILYSLPISAIEMLERNGKSAGRIFKKLRGNIQHSISAISLLNTVANTAGAAVAGAIALNVLGQKWLALFSAVLTLGILIFSEIVPKTLGIAYNQTLSGPAAQALRLIVLTLSPFTWFINHLIRLITPNLSGTAKITPQEIASMVRLGRKSGAIQALEEKIIYNILGMNKKKVKDIMTPRTVVFSIPAAMTLSQAHEQARGWPHSRIPLYEENSEDIVGMVLRRDIFTALGDGRGNLTLGKIMRPIDFVPNNVSLDSLLIKFLKDRQHLFIVVDEYGNMDGLVTLEDALETIIGQEIVGEFDPAVDMRELARRRHQRFKTNSAT